MAIRPEMISAEVYWTRREVHFCGGGSAHGVVGVGEGRALRVACSTVQLDFLGPATDGSDSDFFVSTGFLLKYWGECCFGVIVGDEAVLMDASAVVPGSTRWSGASKRMVRWWDAAGLITTDLRCGGMIGVGRQLECLLIRQTLHDHQREPRYARSP